MAFRQLPNNTAAFWSAVAATFSAISSFLIMWIQRRNLLESVRPELVLTGWSRAAEDQGAYEVIAFNTIKNVGRGAAFHVWLEGIQEAAAGMSTTRVPILAVNEGTGVNGQILVWWKNVEPNNEGFRFLRVTITISCLDSRDMRHDTRYSLLVRESAGDPVLDAIAPGVGLNSRTTTTRSLWLLKLLSKLGHIPGLGRLFRRAK